MGSLLDELRSASDDQAGGGNFAQSWKPAPGGEVEGVVVGLNNRVIENHPDGYPIVTIRQENGEDIAVHGVHQVLKDEITKRNLRVGDQFGLGRVTGD